MIVSEECADDLAVLKPSLIFARASVYGFGAGDLAENAAYSLVIELVPLTVVKTEDAVGVIRIERNLVNELIDLLDGNVLENK